MERKGIPVNLFPAEGKRLLEALILCSAEPLTLKVLTEISDLETSEILELLSEIQMDYQQQNRGFALTEIAGGWMFATYPEHAPYIEKLVKPRLSSLSQAALEVLSIVAYRQPITRAEIEEIRGVSCDSSLGTLLDRGLVEEKGRKDAPGRPILFGTTTDFLKYFGLSSLKELPAFPSMPAEGEDAGNTDQIV